MFCFIAFAVLAIMGLFSSTHWQLAKEAFSCIGRRVTFRPCDTGFKEKVQGQMVGFLMKRSVTAARLVRKNFELLSWIFFILTVWSLWATADGLYNFYKYGSCDGLNQTGFCVFDPTGSNAAFSDSVAINTDFILPSCDGATGPENALLSKIPLSLEKYPTIAGDEENHVVMIGCFECRYTRETVSRIDRLLTEQNPTFTFVHHPVFNNTGYLTNIVQCLYEESGGDEWWQVVKELFATDISDLQNEEYVLELTRGKGFDDDSLQSCITEKDHTNFTKQQRQEVINTGLYGTPLIFVNETAIVGPKPYRVYRLQLQ